MLDDGQWAQVNELALWLHATRERAALQLGVFERLEQAIPHRASFFDLCRMREGRIEYFCPVSATIDPSQLAAYYERYAAQDYTTWSFTSHRPTVYRDLDLISPAARDVTPIYTEWMEPQGLYYGMGCTIVAGGVIYGSVTLFREREAGDFTDAEMELFTQVARHLNVRFSQLWPTGFADEAAGSPIERLAEDRGVSERERRVLELMAGGATNREIARTLFISESTVKKHVNAVYRKLGVRNRVELARALYPEDTPRS